MYSQFYRWVKYSHDTSTFEFDTTMTPEYLNEKEEKRIDKLSEEEILKILKENIYESDEEEA